MEAVRSATPEDADRIGELAAELLVAVTSARGGVLLVDPGTGPPDRARLARVLADLLGRDDYLLLAGTIDQAVTGFALCHREDLGGPAQRGILDACYVEQGARGVGVGRLLLDTALSWFEAHGCDGVDGVALPGDRGAKNFYEAAGFKARMLTMHRELE